MLRCAVLVYRIGFLISMNHTRHGDSTSVKRFFEFGARLKWSQGSMDFQSIANVSSAAACGAHVYCITQKPLPPPGFAFIRFQRGADGEGRPHWWHAADGRDGVSLEHGPAAFFSFS